MPSAKDFEDLEQSLKHISETFGMRVASITNRILRPAEQERVAHIKKELGSLYDE